MNSQRNTAEQTGCSGGQTTEGDRPSHRLAEPQLNAGRG
jgi:hypothetical protein